MATVVVLGGAGGIGSVAVAALGTATAFDRIVVADVRLEAAAAVVASVGDPRMEARAFDATSPASIAEVLAGADVVLNCVGPFYAFGPPLLSAAIEAGVDYVDVCDDLAPTRTMLALDGRAKERGVKALVGMGNSPGLANLFVKLCADTLLEQVESADILHIHGGEPVEGPAVVKHRILAMTDPVPLFIDGAFVEVQQLGEDGAAHVVEADFHRVGRYPVYPYPHPETITLPAHIPGIRTVTNKGVIFPLSYFHLTQDMVRVGLTTTQPLRVGGADVAPIEVAVAHILARRPALLAEAGVTGAAGCLKVVVSGTSKEPVGERRHAAQGPPLAASAPGDPGRYSQYIRGVSRGRSAADSADGPSRRRLPTGSKGARKTYVFQLSSSTVGAGEGTGIPAAAGAVLMARGGVKAAGVLPPEAAVGPLPLLMEAFRMVKALGKGGEDSIRIEQIDADGRVSAVPLPF